MPNSPEWKAALQRLRRIVKTAHGFSEYGKSSCGIESMVMSVSRRILDRLDREGVASLARGGDLPASIAADIVNDEMTSPTAHQVGRPLQVGRPPLTFTAKYRASGRGGDMWMRENKDVVNRAVVDMQSASGESSRVPLKGKMLASLKKRVGWRLFRALPKGEKDSWIERAMDERNYLGYVPEASPARKKKPLKRKQDVAMTKALVDATNEVLTDGDGAARDKRLVKRIFCETALRAGLSIRRSKQLVPGLGGRLRGIAGRNRRNRTLATEPPVSGPLATERPARPPPAKKISDDDILDSLKRQSVESCRWSAPLNRPRQTVLASRRHVWSRLPELNQKIGYRRFCQRTTHGKLGIERARSRYHYDEH